MEHLKELKIRRSWLADCIHALLIGKRKINGVIDELNHNLESTEQKIEDLESIFMKIKNVTMSKISDTQIGKEKLLTCKQCGKKYKRLKGEYCGDSDTPPLTCHDPECGRELTADEVTDYYNDIEDDDDKPYCNGCISKMDATERAVDDSLVEGE